MIPHKLQLKNFISYGNEIQTVDFTPYHLIYLSGKNGHGKSALLDAITWAIWGHARKVGTAVKADLGLIRLGQTNMLVVLDFELNHQMYRVRRELTLLHGKLVAQLEFGMLNPQTNELIPLTDKTIRATQTKIEETIRLDYEAFINSAFLRQGHANEFSQKSPKDRKEILGSILGLSQFELIKRRALEKAKNALTEKQTRGVLHEKITLQLAQKPLVDEQSSTIQAQLESLTKEYVVLNAQQTELTSQRVVLNEQQKKYELAHFQYTQISTEIEKQTLLIKELAQQWRTINRKQRTLGDIKTLETKKNELREKLDIHQRTLAQSLSLKEQILHTRDTAQRVYLELEQVHAATLQNHTLALERVRYEQITTNTALAQLNTQQIALSQEILETEKVLETIKQQQSKEPLLIEQEALFEKRKNAYQQFIAQGNWLKNELDNIAQKEELSHDDQNPSCPLCEQNLSLSRRKFLRTKFTQQKKLIEHQLERLTRVIKKLKTMLIEQHEIITTRKAALAFLHEHTKHLERITSQITAINQQREITEKKQKELIIEIEKAVKTLDEYRSQTAQLIAQDLPYLELKRTLTRLEKESLSLAYNANEHQRIQAELAIIEQRLASYQDLQIEIAHNHERANQVSSLINILRERKQERTILEQSLKAYTELAQRTIQLTASEQTIAQIKLVLDERKNLLLQKQGSLSEQLKQLTQLAKESTEQQTVITNLSSIIDDYQTIATATGKDGVQALLIEEAIPEIEQEANFLLSKLTNNQAHIFIESLRDLKKGGSKETLDINISDPSGIRPYELFSGGEAFRIDFALRVAISKLLARRAGTALQTLIIDEGFGSQDEDGLTHIMDAIVKIQDSFEKVIIVSHLPSMREQFPVHFVVEKGPEGSKITVIEEE